MHPFPAHTIQRLQPLDIKTNNEDIGLGIGKRTETIIAFFADGIVDADGVCLFAVSMGLLVLVGFVNELCQDTVDVAVVRSHRPILQIIYTKLCRAGCTGTSLMRLRAHFRTTRVSYQVLGNEFFSLMVIECA